MKNPSTLVLIAVLGVAVPHRAATFTVVNTNDLDAGSLRQAILDANATPGADVIVFNIPSGGLTISPASALPPLTEPVTIDGATQPGFAGAPVIEIAGASAGAGVDGLTLPTSNSVIRALIINRFTRDGIAIAEGANNTVEGCYLGLNRAGLTDQGNTRNGIYLTNAANNTIGGLAVSNRNYISGNNQSGIHIGGAAATNNLVLGNVIGLNLNQAAIANSVDGIRLNAPLNRIGGSASGARNLISGNTGQGIEITPQGLGAVIQGNYLGTDATGALDRGNTLDGILVSAGGVVIGGAGAGEGNLISGNNGDGIELNGASATNAVVLGNTIGASEDGATGLLNNGHGVLITGGSRGNLIGGVLPGQGNRIAFNGADGISVAAAVANTNNTFRGNAIFSNSDLGIDLGATGVTANDPGDADGGANQLQNFPLLTAVTNTGSSVSIAGSLNSTPGRIFTLDFYGNSLFDPTGYGEGEVHVGSASATTDASGNATFSVLFPVAVPTRYFSATATDPHGNTSEFGPVVTAQGVLPATTFTVINTNDSGPGSLRQAILDANAAITDGADRIHFAIPGAGPHLIAPLTELPLVTDPVFLDGYTQAGASPNTLATGNDAVLRIRLDGNAAPSGVPGLTLWGGGSTVRGLAITRFRGATGHGLSVRSAGNVIQGNFIGVGTDGLTDLGNAGDGVWIGGGNNLIGGAAPAARNLISGNSGDGIEINGVAASGNTVQGNYLGTRASGTLPVRNDGHGIQITASASGNTIGGLGAGEGNVIAFNGSTATFDGVFVASGTNNPLRGNLIFENSGLGIDLGANGVTLNDAGDADTGANQLQNFPVLASVTTNSAPAVTITGALSSAANTGYALDFYANAQIDLSGHGEGQFRLGSTEVTTDGGGQAAFSLTLPTALPGRFVSAMATDPAGNSSEFARWVIAVDADPPTSTNNRAADFVFIIDASGSMAGEIAAVRSGLGSFVGSLNTNEIDARFAVVLFGGTPELVLNFTTDQLVTESAFDLINVSGAVPGIQNNHNVNPEAGLEAIRIVLNAAATNGLMRNNVGGDGPLVFRPDARKNLILVTDENSDLPFYAANRQPGQSGTEPPTTLTAPWQAEIDATAQAVIANQAFINMLINPAATPSRFQYGDPAQSASDPNFLNFDPDLTLTNLVSAGYGRSLEAQVLAAGLIGRTFNITVVDTTNFVANFFAAKIEEIIDNPIPPPRLNIAPLHQSVRLTWTTNSAGYLLVTNRSLLLTNQWGVLTTNYGIIGTNYAVTNSTDDALRFYRLRK